MNLPAGTHLAYYVCRYLPPDDPTAVAELSVRASDDREPGAAWEIMVQELNLGGERCTMLQIYDDAYSAVVHQIPEFFAALAERRPRSLGAVRAILDELGAVNET